MKNPIRLSLLIIAGAFCVLSLRASDLTGTWTSEFDSQIGKQKYIYEFKKDGDVYTGTAKAEIEETKRTNKLSDISVKNEAVAFVEMTSYDGNDLQITYTGKIAGDEMKLTRKVAEYATEEIVAKRVANTPAPEPKK